MSSLKNACVGTLHALTHTLAHFASSRKRQRRTSTCWPAPSPGTTAAAASAPERSSTSHGPMSHCPASAVTRALSFALKAGSGRAKRISNHQSSPGRAAGGAVAASAPKRGGQSGNNRRSTRCDASAASAPRAATSSRTIATTPE